MRSKRRDKSAEEAEDQARWTEAAGVVSRLRDVQHLLHLEMQRSELRRQLDLPGGFFLHGESGLETLARLDAEYLALARALGLVAT